MKKVDLFNFENSEYNPGSFIKRTLWFFSDFLLMQRLLFFSSTLRIKLLTIFGAKIGKNVNLKPSVQVKYPWFLEIEDNVWIGEHVWIDNLAFVKVESNACLSQGCYLLTGNHNYKSTKFDLITGSITIEEGAWIGAKSIVCPGITCGSHSILSAGSVATKNLENYSIYQGNPAIFIRKREIKE